MMHHTGELMILKASVSRAIKKLEEANHDSLHSSQKNLLAWEALHELRTTMRTIKETEQNHKAMEMFQGEDE